MTLEVANPGERPAPYACGLHPGFRWPLGDAGRGRARSCASRRRSGRRFPSLAPGGLVTAKTRPVPLTGRDLPLSDPLFAADALCFLDCLSRELAFVDASGASVSMEFPDYSARRPLDAARDSYVCLECWTGYSDPEGFAGDLFEKPSMRVLEPGARARHEARFVYRAA